jgi:hypothetical protein
MITLRLCAPLFLQDKGVPMAYFLIALAIQIDFHAHNNLRAHNNIAYLVRKTDQGVVDPFYGCDVVVDRTFTVVIKKLMHFF